MLKKIMVFSARILGAFVVITTSVMSASAATSASQFGITWTFSADRPTGQFANGDWWVLGPVTIIHISPSDPTPSDNFHIHGTMINPQYNITGKPNWNGNQGWDSRIRDSNYNALLNIGRSLPHTVQNSGSIMTCKSILEQSTGNDVQMDTIAVLTVVQSEPSPGSFRPPYVGTDKTIRWNKASLDYSKLRSLPMVPNAPSLAEVESYFEKAHIALGPSWSGTYLHPKSNDFPGYGREISHKVGAGALSLNLNYSAKQKETLLVRMIQRGIDIYGIQAAGGGWWPDGGHNHGRKFPMILAGTLLNDREILSKANGGFAEDGQHFYVSQADVDRPRKTGREPYTVKMIGTPEWGGNHIGQPEGDGSQWSVPYRTLVGVSNMGPILAASIMGVKTSWNHPATFDYMDRFYSVENGNVSTGTNSIQPFVATMWTTYRNSSNLPDVPPTAVSDIKIGTRIELTKNTNVRDTGSLSGTLVGTQVVGMTGTIVAGPILSNSITWWKVDYDSEVDGWSGADNFTVSSTPPPTVPDPPVNPSFAVGTRIELIKNTNVRDTGSLSGTLLGSQAIGMTGTIVTGPTISSGITWWQVNYDSGTDGWCGADNFTVSLTPPPTVSEPPVNPGFTVGTRIELIKNTNVRDTGSLSGSLLGSQAVGMTGTIVTGPTLSSGITWWQVNYDSGTDGWSGADNFTISLTPPPTVSEPPANPSFAVGTRIELIKNTNVRDTGSLSGTLLGSQAVGMTGTIVTGPTFSSGITWWQVNYDSGTDGWSGADNFTVSSSSPPTVSEPPSNPSFAVGTRIELIKNTNVRDTGSLSGTLLGSQAVGMTGTIVTGPTLSSGITWWQVNYDSGTDGWSGADNFTVSSTPPPVVLEPPINPSFTVGARIEVIKNTNVRKTGSLTGTLLGTQAIGMTGTITAGPILANSITWWDVNYDAGTDGWSGADNFLLLQQATQASDASFSTNTLPAKEDVDISSPTLLSSPTKLRLINE
jgi:uncharacterized membrane protein YjfL (UPF0719 family)